MVLKTLFSEKAHPRCGKCFLIFTAASVPRRTKVGLTNRVRYFAGHNSIYTSAVSTYVTLLSRGKTGDETAASGLLFSFELLGRSRFPRVRELAVSCLRSRFHHLQSLVADGTG